ncbi:MAG: septum formation initiator family protein [Gammaproteobacteria bacterium]|jgi:cell division protein FtsB
MNSRAVLIVLGLMLAGLQWRLWVADGGVSHAHQLKRELAQMRAENERLRLRNQALDAEVIDLNSGVQAIESRARTTLGMVRRDETFYLVVSR